MKSDVIQAVKTHEEYIKRETLAESIHYLNALDENMCPIEIEGEVVYLMISKVEDAG